MSLINFLDRNALKIQIVFGDFTTEIKSYDQLAAKYNATRCLTNPQDLINYLNRKLNEFKSLRAKCFTEVTFEYNNRILTVYQAEAFMRDKILAISTIHKIR